MMWNNLISVSISISAFVSAEVGVIEDLIEAIIPFILDFTQQPGSLGSVLFVSKTKS